MKKTLAFLLIVIISFTFTACTGNSDDVIINRNNQANTSQVNPQLSVSHSTSPVDTKTTVMNTNNDPPAGDGMGGENYLGYPFIDEVGEMNITFFTKIMGIDYEQINVFNHTIIEPHKWEQQTQPLIYKAIQHFDISKEKFIEANNKAVEYNNMPENEGFGIWPIYREWIIEALYCGDEKQMRKTLMDPYALYSEVDGNLYTLIDICGIDQEHEYEGMPADLEAMISAETLYHELGFSSDDLQGLFDRISKDYPIGFSYLSEKYPLLLRLDEIRALEKADATTVPTTTPQPSGGGGDIDLGYPFNDRVGNMDYVFFRDILGIDVKETTAFLRTKIEAHKWEQQTKPLIYEAIQHFSISKEKFIEANNKAAEYNKTLEYPFGIWPIYEDWEIEALYCGDEKQMRKTLMGPYALYSEVDGNLYTLIDICGIDQEHEYEGMPADLEAMISAETLYHELGFSSDDLQGLFDRISADYPIGFSYLSEKYPLLLRLEEIRALEKADAIPDTPASAPIIP